MAGTFILGETKVRPGTYFNVQKVGENEIPEMVNGVTAVLFKSDWGPLNQPVELSAGDGYENTFGDAGTTDAIRQVFAGGAVTVIGCRIGSGGSKAEADLLNSQGESAARLKAKYAGEKSFTVTVREKLTDSEKKECIIYSGTKEFERVEFEAGGNEAAALAEAFKSSGNFDTEVMETESMSLANVSQSPFTKGVNPVTTVDSYSNGFAAVESYRFDTICVDTEDRDIHLLLQSFINRIYDIGQLTLGVVAEKTDLDLEDRMANARSLNDEKMIYVLNASINEAGRKLEGYQAAARIAGMVSASPSNKSLTHQVLSGVTELNEVLTPTMMAKAEQQGCIVLSVNANKQVWIDNGINTLVNPGENQDEGWKKIRRTKTRYELITRANRQVDSLIGRIDNDANGRATIVGQIQGIANAMIEEGKLIACTVSENSRYESNGDSAWFEIDAIDKDSVEHIYLNFKFRFSTQG